MAFNRLQQPNFANGGTYNERDHIDARYMTDCIQEVPETARSRDFNQNTDRPMVNILKAVEKVKPEPLKSIFKQKTEAKIEKYDQKNKDVEEFCCHGPDAFKDYCEATCYDERVAIQ